MTFDANSAAGNVSQGGKSGGDAMGGAFAGAGAGAGGVGVFGAGIGMAGAGAGAGQSGGDVSDNTSMGDITINA